MGVRNRIRLLIVGAMALLLVVPGAAAFAQRDANADAEAEVTIAGRDATTIDRNEPLELESDEPVELTVAVTNPGDDPVFVRSVRLRSVVIGIPFVVYETRIDMEVAPGETGERTFQLDLLDLRSQATGLMPAEIELLDAERRQVAALPITIDVQGSFWSVYGGFALAVAALTALVLARDLVQLARGRLPANRWTRGVQFGAPGLGIGLVATFTLSALRIFSPAPALWGTLLVVFGGGLFILGYLTPTPADEYDEIDEAEGDLVEDHATAGAPSTLGPDDRPRTERAAPPTVGDEPKQEPGE